MSAEERSAPPASGPLSGVAARGALWTGAASYSGKLLVFASTLVLARLLDAEDFGLAGYAMVAIAFLDVTQDFGVGAALIYAPESERTNNTAFWLSALSAALLFALAWFAAPWVGVFFDEPRAVPLTRALALSFPLAALGNVHSTLLRKRLRFARRFAPELARSVAKGTASIAFAFAGLGAWSLVLGQLIGAGVAVLAFWWVVPWRPRFEFDARVARSLLGYGWNIAAVDSMAVVLNKVDNLFVGRFLGTAALGIYTLAFRIPELLVKQFAQSTGQVLFPVYSRMRDDPRRLREALLRSLRLLALVTVPASVGLAVLAEPIVRLLLSDKWIAAAPVMALIALYAGVRALTMTLGGVYKAQGRPEVLLRLALLQLPVTVAALWWAAQVGGSVVAVARMQLALALAFGVLRFGVASWLLEVPPREWLRVFGPLLASAALMAAAVAAALAHCAASAVWLQVVLGVSVGAAVYWLALLLIARDALRAFVSELRRIGAKRRPSIPG